jgi:hypothetical protein
MVLMFLPIPNTYDERVIANVMAFGSGVFGR